MPTWIQWLAHVLPPVYVFEGMRAIVTGGTVSVMSLVIGGALAVFDVLGASVVFTRVYRKAVRTGTHRTVQRGKRHLARSHNW